MSLISLVIVLLVLGLVWWLFQTYIMPKVPEPFRSVIIVVVVLAACLWLLSIAGIDITLPITKKGV